MKVNWKVCVDVYGMLQVAASFNGGVEVGASRDCSEVDVIWQGGVHPEVDQGTSTLTPVIGHGQVDCSSISPVGMRCTRFPAR